MEEWEQRLADEDTPVYPIGMVAELLDVPVTTVRRYDDAELVSPTRSQGRQRRYSRRNIARLSRILRLAAEGIPIAGIKRILDLEDELAEVRSQQQD